jgi:predicted AlkP superfamily phosphohydrolase/phosphomutase
MGKKVLVIGLDGATWNLIKPWIDEGKLATLERLTKQGVYGELESTVPPWTIPAWNSLTTGKNPGKLGVFTFMCKYNAGYKFKPYFLVYEVRRDVWKILSTMERKVIVANVPNIHFSFKINGYIVAGWLYRDEDTLTYPKTLKGKLDEVTDGYKVDIITADVNKGTIVKRPSTDEEYLHMAEDTTNKHFRAFEFLLKKKWDFAFLVFTGPDRIQHKFWENEKIVLDYYKNLDIKLGNLLKMVDKSTVLILVSDHGFGPKKRIFNVNEWLLKENYLRLKPRTVSKLVKIKILLAKIKMLPLVKFLLAFFPLKPFKSLKEKSAPITKVEVDNIDWEKTKAFNYSVWGDIYLNVKGREARGIINPEEYEKTREEIIQKLKNLEDPTSGKKFSAKVYRREEIYQGKYINRAPDLVIQVDDNIQSINSTVGHNQIFMEGKGGEHRINGIFLACGPGIKRGTQIKGIRIYDITPTILHIFNLPIPSDMDGRVLMEIFEPDSEFARREPVYVDPAYYDKKMEEEKLRTKIKDLKLKGEI